MDFAVVVRQGEVARRESMDDALAEIPKLLGNGFV
jgi:hypothetical protein